MLDTTHIQKSAKTIRDSVELFFNQLKPFAELETIEQKQEYHLKGLLQSAVTVLEPSKETFLRLQRSGLTNDISFALINYEQLYTRCKFLLDLLCAKYRKPGIDVAEFVRGIYSLRATFTRSE